MSEIDMKTLMVHPRLARRLVCDFTLTFTRHERGTITVCTLVTPSYTRNHTHAPHYSPRYNIKETFIHS
jgi:hypothetical protein